MVWIVKHHDPPSESLTSSSVLSSSWLLSSQGPDWLCAVLHRSFRQRAELQLWSVTAGSVLHQLYQDGEGEVRHPLEDLLHHQSGPIPDPGPCSHPSSRWNPPRQPLSHRVRAHSRPQYGRHHSYTSPSRHPGFPILYVWQHLRSWGSDYGSFSNL